MAYRLEQQDAATREALVALGSVLRELRMSRSLTQRKLEARCGLSQSSISRLETGKAPWMSAVWIARLLAGLDLAADGVYFRPTATPSEGPGWKFLMARFDAAHRRREQMTLADIRRLDRERALEALRRELAADTERPAPT
ncbi:MAG TPA: helix-turn-helix transcriptional regulator [Candidatus Sulfomarinibacteraceae bacterium]|nr:helix-turn-helix transcriptional regulator [Candidatus Sulfomarinibacteraceae bacterium]